MNLFICINTTYFFKYKISIHDNMIINICRYYHILYMSASSPEFKLIVALCRGGGIGLQETLPWPKLERDLRFFSQMTRAAVFPYNSAVVMGRKTWESIPESVKPLPFREMAESCGISRPLSGPDLMLFLRRYVRRFTLAYAEWGYSGVDAIRSASNLVIGKASHAKLLFRGLRRDGS